MLEPFFNIIMCAKRQLKPRTRNAGTMTEAEFWSMIRSSLRQRSVFWKPLEVAKKLARRRYRGPNKRRRWEYQCAKCEQYFSDKEIHIDHIVPAGSLRTYEDLPEFVKNLFCEVEGFQVLCESCHAEKTKIDNIKTKIKRTKL